MPESEQESQERWYNSPPGCMIGIAVLALGIGLGVGACDYLGNHHRFQPTPQIQETKIHNHNLKFTH